MLAYSSIAHAGYILVGLLAQNAEGHAGVLFYVLAYTFMNLGAFGDLDSAGAARRRMVTMDDLQGLAQRQPWAAGLMAIFMLSLGGIPPTVGFTGKFFLFLPPSAVHALPYYSLAVIGLVSSVIGVYYYLRVIARMVFQPAKREFPANVWSFAPGAAAAVWVSAIATLVFGIFSSGLYNIATQGAESLESANPSARLTAQAPAPVQRASAR